MALLPLKHLAPIVVLLALGAVLPTNAQKISWGSCPSVTGISTFDQTAFVSHVWYEAQRYDNLVEFLKRCVQWQFVATSTTVMTATTTMKDLFGNTQTVVGTFTQGTPVAKFRYHITQLPGLGIGIQRDHDVYILATDYTTYAVMWTCTNRIFKNEQLMWILTSTRTPTTATLAAARAAVSSRQLDISRLITTSQTNC